MGGIFSDYMSGIPLSYSSWGAPVRFPCLPYRSALGTLVFFLLLTGVDLGMPTPSVANPETVLPAFNAFYPSSPLTPLDKDAINNNATNDCTVCHKPSFSPSLFNPYGTFLDSNNANFALDATTDSDGDGVNNKTEIDAGFLPGNAGSTPPPPSFTLTVALAGTGSGTVSASGITCATGTLVDCTESYTAGTSVTLNNTPDADSFFAGYSGDADCTDGQVTMTADRNCTATFTLNSFTLTVTKDGAGSGTVTSNLAGIDCGADCLESYTSGTSLTLMATADTGSVFTGWNGGGCSGTANCTVTLTADTTVTATFAAIPPLDSYPDHE